MTIKEEIKKSLLEKVQDELDKAEQAYNSARTLTQSDDFKSESKWDTRATEAGYLASAQKQRVEDLKLELKLIEEIDITALKDSDEISLGALVELEHNNLKRFYFLSSTAGGTPLLIQNRPILVISVFSPLGKELLGLNVGEEVELEIGEEIKEYKVCSIS
jgi:transcription elongation GreA/GreB family factor